MHGSAKRNFSNVNEGGVERFHRNLEPTDQKSRPKTPPRKKPKTPRKKLMASLITPENEKVPPVFHIKGAITEGELLNQEILEQIGWLTPGDNTKSEKDTKKPHRNLAIFSRDKRAEYSFKVREESITLKASSHSKAINQMVMDLTKQIALAVRNCEVLGKNKYNIQLPVFNVANGTGYVNGGLVPKHSDDEKDHTHDLIASVSFGGSAVFYIEALGNDGEKREFPVRLEHGDLVLFDRNLKHRADAPDRKKYRLNLTFRQFKLPWFHKPSEWE